MISAKLARLVNGQINDADSWCDIAGYALLIHNQIMADNNAKADAKAGNTAKSALQLIPNPFADKTVIDTMETEIARDLSGEKGQ